MLIKIILLLGCLAPSIFCVYPYAVEHNIINLGEPTFELALKDYPDGVLVYFYEAYCNPCRRLWPELVDAATKNSSVVRFAKVDCHDEIDLCNTRKVFTFPTLLLHVQNKQPYEYRGARNSTDIQQWLLKVADHQFPIVDHETTLFKKFSAAILVNSNQVLNVNSAYVDNLDNIEIAVAGPSLKAQMADSSAVLITQRGEITPISPDDTAAGVTYKIRGALFTRKNVAPYLSWTTYSQLTGDQDFKIIIFFKTHKFKPQRDDSLAFDKAYNEFQSQELKFAYVNVDDDLIGHELGKLFGLNTTSKPTVGIISRVKKANLKYKLVDDAITFENLQKFLQEFENGLLKRYYMSASPDPSVKKVKGQVEELIASDYQSVTMDPKLNVFVQFYFPWCEQSVKFNPIWNKLAYRVRDHENVKIAKININQNDIEGFDNVVCASLVFYPEGESKKPIDYGTTENITIKNLQNFLTDKIPQLLQNFDL